MPKKGKFKRITKLAKLKVAPSPNLSGIPSPRDLPSPSPRSFRSSPQVSPRPLERRSSIYAVPARFIGDEAGKVAAINSELRSIEHSQSVRGKKLSNTPSEPPSSGLKLQHIINEKANQNTQKLLEQKDRELRLVLRREEGMCAKMRRRIEELQEHSYDISDQLTDSNATLADYKAKYANALCTEELRAKQERYKLLKDFHQQVTLKGTTLSQTVQWVIMKQEALESSEQAESEAATSAAEADLQANLQNDKLQRSLERVKRESEALRQTIRQKDGKITSLTEELAELSEQMDTMLTPDMLAAVQGSIKSVTDDFHAIREYANRQIDATSMDLAMMCTALQDQGLAPLTESIATLSADLEIKGTAITLKDTILSVFARVCTQVDTFIRELTEDFDLFPYFRSINACRDDLLKEAARIQECDSSSTDDTQSQGSLPSASPIDGVDAEQTSSPPLPEADFGPLGINILHLPHPDSEALADQPLYDILPTLNRTLSAVSELASQFSDQKKLNEKMSETYKAKIAELELSLGEAQKRLESHGQETQLLRERLNEALLLGVEKEQETFELRRLLKESSEQHEADLAAADLALQSAIVSHRPTLSPEQESHLRSLYSSVATNAACLTNPDEHRTTCRHAQSIERQIDDADIAYEPALHALTFLDDVINLLQRKGKKRGRDVSEPLGEDEKKRLDDALSYRKKRWHDKVSALHEAKACELTVLKRLIECEQEAARLIGRDSKHLYWLQQKMSVIDALLSSSMRGTNFADPDYDDSDQNGLSRIRSWTAGGVKTSVPHNLRTTLYHGDKPEPLPEGFFEQFDALVKRFPQASRDPRNAGGGAVSHFATEEMMWEEKLRGTHRLIREITKLRHVKTGNNDADDDASSDSDSGAPEGPLSRGLPQIAPVAPHVCSAVPQGRTVLHADPSEDIASPAVRGGVLQCIAPAGLSRVQITLPDEVVKPERPARPLFSSHMKERKDSGPFLPAFAYEGKVPVKVVLPNVAVLEKVQDPVERAEAIVVAAQRIGRKDSLLKQLRLRPSKTLFPTRYNTKSALNVSPSPSDCFSLTQ